jgi:hypothetical protein
LSLTAVAKQIAGREGPGDLGRRKVTALKKTILIDASLRVLILDVEQRTDR